MEHLWIVMMKELTYEIDQEILNDIRIAMNTPYTEDEVVEYCDEDEDEVIELTFAAPNRNHNPKPPQFELPNQSVTNVSGTISAGEVWDGGYFYTPYIPLMSTPTVLDPEVFNPRKGALTRYGKKLLDEGSKYYQHLTLEDVRYAGDKNGSCDNSIQGR